MKHVFLISPYWKEKHRWMVSSVKLAELWQRIGYRVTVVCMGPETKVETVSDTLTIHYRKDVFLPDPWNYGIAPGFAGYVRRLIAREKPDVIAANKILFWSSLSVIALCLTGRRVILLTDALVGMTWWPRSLFPKICAAVYAWTAGWLILLCAKKVVFFHPQPERLLRVLGIARKSVVIPTGIDASRFLLPASRSYGLTVTYIGRLESVKGVDDFVTALVPLKRDFPDMRLQVVGWYRPGHPLVERYREEVVFAGLREDIPTVLAGTDIFVMPSYSEGLSNAIMEAMASGCACIASEVGGNRFLIRSGISGFLFAPGDTAALRAHVRRLVEDAPKRAALGRAARERIEREFDWKVVGERYRALFQ